MASMMYDQFQYLNATTTRTSHSQGKGRGEGKKYNYKVVLVYTIVPSCATTSEDSLTDNICNENDTDKNTSSRT